MTPRALNRALLARQMLLEREPTSVIGAIERLIGLQAQQPWPPFVGLWSRVECFERDTLLALYQERAVVRATMMRATLHLVSADDYIRFRSAIQPVLTAAMKGIAKARSAAFDSDAIVQAAASVFRKGPHSFAEVRSELAAAFPDVDERAMGYAARMCLRLVMVPDNSEDGFTGAAFTHAESWLGRNCEEGALTEALVLRYLAAFGPASIADAQSWSGLSGLKPLFERLLPQLLVLRDARNRELFDVPDAPRPPEEVPAPVRFIPAFDNLILSHADRNRIIADEHRPRVSLKNLQILPTFLVDGFVAGVWSTTLRRKSATLTIAPFGKLTRAVKRALEAEGQGLLRFTFPHADGFEIVFQDPDQRERR